MAARGKRPAKRPAEQQFNSILGRRVEVIRRARKVTRVALAAKLGVTGSQLYWWETGRDRIPMYFLDLICRELAVPLAELVQNTTTRGNPVKTGMKAGKNLLVSYAKSIALQSTADGVRADHRSSAKDTI